MSLKYAGGNNDKEWFKTANCQKAVLICRHLFSWHGVRNEKQ